MQKGKIKIKGSTTEERFKSIEKFIQHLFGRMHKTVTFAAPPIPISSFCERLSFDDNVMVRYICSFKGTIKNIIFFCDKIKKSQISLIVSIENSKGIIETKFKRKSGTVSKSSMEYDVEQGDRITIKAYSTIDSDITNAWIGFLINIDKSSYDFEQQNIDQLGSYYAKEIRALCEGSTEDEQE